MSHRYTGFIAALLIFLAWDAHAGEKVRVGVLMSDSLTSTVRTVYGAEKSVTQTYAHVEFFPFYVNSSAQRDQQVVDSLRKVQPRLLLTIGSAATRFAQVQFPTTPTIFAAVMYPELSGFVPNSSQKKRNITGASLDIPVDVQFRYFKKIVPELKRVGVMYSDSTASLITPARNAARALDIELVSVKITDSKQLPNALDSLATVTQGIWSLADPVLFDPQSTRYILLNTLRKGIPFMGFSQHVVESGALFALDFDYKAVGRQAGELVNRVIAGEEPSTIAVTSADVIWFHFNEKTAHHIEVTIPAELVAVAKEIYR